jgi:DNA-binding GntR family transcriptional regulator
MAEAQEEHRRLFEALRRRSTADAVMAMTEHRRRTLDSWRKAFL